MSKYHKRHGLKAPEPKKEERTCKCFKVAKKLFERGERQVLCVKMKSKRVENSWVPAREIRKCCVTVEDAFNFFYGKKFIKG